MLGPDVTRELLAKHHGDRKLAEWGRAHENVQIQRKNVESARLQGEWTPQYRFNDGVLEPSDVTVDSDQITLGDRRIDLSITTPEDWRL